jgi:hypothetical protein
MVIDRIKQKKYVKGLYKSSSVISISTVFSAFSLNYLILQDVNSCKIIRLVDI